MLKALAPAALLALLAAPAHATLEIALDVAGTDFFCADNAACDTNPTLGVLQIGAQTINGVAVNGSIQTSSTSPDSLNTSSLLIRNTSILPKAVAFVVSATGYTGPVSSVHASGSGTWESAGGSTASLEWFADPLNRQGAGPLFATPGALIASFASTAVGDADSFSHDGAAPFAGTLFSMTESASGTLVAGGSLVNRGQAEIAVIPEASTWAMILVGFLGLAFAARKRARDA